MRKQLLILVAALALTLPMATPVGATPPTRAEFPVPPEGFPLDPTLCGFPVHLSPLKDKAKVTTFYNTQGQPRFSLTNGSLKLRLTSPTRSIDVNVSGPGRFNADFSTLSTQGNWLIFLNNPIPQPNDAPSRLFLVTGRSVMDLDANANATTFRLISGHARDLCSQLS